jgi:NAD(P)-dependent dehydrogenase (short-subunit alcohol dehydrogenase family)
MDIFAGFRLQGRTAVVTGASSGLGTRFVRVLHAAGATVVAAARRTSRIEALAAELGDGVIPVTCDVSLDQDVDELVERTLTRANGRIDVVVNNAGISNVGPAETEERDAFRRVINVNLIAVFAVSQAIGRVMLRQNSGSIVNIASIHGFVAGSPVKQASYCASKSGVVNLTRELAVQWARQGVRVNAIAPGYFPSEMTTRMWDNEKSLEYIRRNAPLGRGGREDELDGALLFLASNASSYVTGHTLVVDGGWTAR